MRVKLFTLRYSASLGGFDDTPLLEFSRDKELISFREHFFSVGDVVHLACVVVYQEAVVRPETLKAARQLREAATASKPARRSCSRRGGPDPTEGLDEQQRAVFNTLREWRAAKAREEGVPPFLIFTNKQLLEVILQRPPSAVRGGRAARGGTGDLVLP